MWDSHISKEMGRAGIWQFLSWPWRFSPIYTQWWISLRNWVPGMFYLNHNTSLCLIIVSKDPGNISLSDLVPSSRLWSTSNLGSMLHLLEEKLLPSRDLLELFKGNFYHCKSVFGLGGSGNVAQWKNFAWQVQGHRFDPAALPPPRKTHPWRWIGFFWITYCRCSTDLRFQNLFAFGAIRGIHLSGTSKFDTTASNIFWTGKEIEN